MTDVFDPTKPIRQRNGMAARIICADRKDSMPIVYLYNDGSGEGVRCAWPDGRSADHPDEYEAEIGGLNPWDLVNIDAAPPVEAPTAPATLPVGYIRLPAGLHPATSALVTAFAEALAGKLRLDEQKYGYSDNWRRDDWRDELVAKLAKHVRKGDPRDVAAYCAFAWHHGWSVAPTATPDHIAAEFAARAVTPPPAAPDERGCSVIPYTLEDDTTPDTDMAGLVMLRIGDRVYDRIPEPAALAICAALRAGGAA